ncbi:MAG: hypothetical protein K8R02_06930 [Anaerohalosphaeraceae bacterium]|nr:hypothetical protein [Anaerohalosphaeraceae bacterium]
MQYWTNPIDAWLCHPNCDSNDLDWDYNSDEQINFFDWAAADMNDFAGAFKTNGRYVLTDFMNSVVGIANGTSITQISYDAWGTPSYTGNHDGLSILWNGYYFDDETDNYYLRNRYYSPLQGLFVTDDPRGINPDGNWNNSYAPITQLKDGVNTKLFLNHNPMYGRDDWGLKCWGGIKEYYIWFPSKKPPFYEKLLFGWYAKKQTNSCNCMDCCDAAETEYRKTVSFLKYLLTKKAKIQICYTRCTADKSPLYWR